MRRSDMKPWARRIPTVVLRLILIIAFPLIMCTAAWDEGIKEGLVGWWSEWKSLGDLE